MKSYYDDDEDYGDALSAAHARGGWRGTLSVWAGAVIAVVIVGGLSYWAWGLFNRSPEDVPMIRAATAPAKERPSDPGGGAETPHQDIAAYGQTDGVETVALAPPAAQPTGEDVPLGELAGVEPVRGEVVAAIVGGVEELEDPVPDAPEGPSAQVLAEQALIQQSLRQVLAEANPGAPNPPIGSTSDHAPAYSPSARTRPGGLAERIAALGTTATDAPAIDNALAERAATSQIQIQLGAFEDRGQVDDEWSRIFGSNRDILSGRALAVQQTVSGGTVYYRLRVGPFRDGHEANTVCQALKARGQDCLVAINTDRRG